MGARAAGGRRHIAVLVWCAVVVGASMWVLCGAPASADDGPTPTTTVVPEPTGTSTTTTALAAAVTASTETSEPELVDYPPEVRATPLAPTTPASIRPRPPAAEPPAVVAPPEPVPLAAEVEVLGSVQEAPEPTEPPPPVPDDLSDISTGIPTTVDFTPTFVASNVGYGALLVLILLAASQLFNDALKMHHDRILANLASRSSLMAGAGAVLGRISGIHPLVTFAIAAGTLGLLADPSVSLNVATIGQVLGMAVGLGVIVAVYEIPAARRIERATGEHQPFRLFPIAIAIAIACLLFSRIFGVAPGVLYGLFAGVLFTSVDNRIAGRAYARASILLGGAAMAAWLLHRWLEGAATDTSPTVWVVLFDTAAAVIFVGGLQSVIVQLLPMPFTYGETVAAWNRTAWVALFVVAMALYMQFVVRPNPDNSSWSNLWFIGAFMALALGFWGVCAFHRWSDGRRAAAVDRPDDAVVG